MQCHRIEELIELLPPVCLKHQDLNLTEILTNIAKDAGFDGNIADVSNDLLFYHLKMLYQSG